MLEHFLLHMRSSKKSEILTAQKVRSWMNFGVEQCSTPEHEPHGPPVRKSTLNGKRPLWIFNATIDLEQ